jgi:hypothetical protein
MLWLFYCAIDLELRIRAHIFISSILYNFSNFKYMSVTDDKVAVLGSNFIGFGVLSVGRTLKERMSSMRAIFVCMRPNRKP